MKSLILAASIILAPLVLAELPENHEEIINQCKEWASVDSIEQVDMLEYLQECVQSMTGEYNQPNYAESDIESEEGVQELGVEQEQLN